MGAQILHVIFNSGHIAGDEDLDHAEINVVKGAVKRNRQIAAQNKSPLMIVPESKNLK